MINYLKNSFKEFSKVSWPTMQQTLRLTVYTVLFTAVLAAAIGALDFLFNAGYQAVVDYSIKSGLGTDTGTTTEQPLDVNDFNVEVEGGTSEGVTIVPEGEVPTEEAPAETEQPAN